ncbi:MAG: zinc-ribbon domain-containing protein [Deltaproteobacteria bacterium]|nr:zinc-ribbon domain-containing protein [Deltaproteobacteria bacterium]
MALVHCPECNKAISDKAAACPHCGVPLKKSRGAKNPRPVKITLYAL